MSTPNCQRWMWIELIGFDNTEPDYHVGAFLDNAGFVPEMLSFLLVSPDFVHGHQGMEREMVLPPDLCSYGGRPYNAERRRQAWTNHQFKGLIEELQRHGVKVFCGVMNSFRSFIDGQPYASPWCASHPEVWEVRHAGDESGAISPLKRLADGSYYEDFYIPKLQEAIADYGFDGSHAGDGVAGPRRPIWMADYSDDMVGQFIEMRAQGQAGVPAPPSFVLHCDGDPERAEQRARYIWGHLRQEWCTFYARRFNQFFTKLCDAMHGMGKQVVANNVWTQDPFQALYRYGLDYRGLAEAGVDAFILETVGAGNEIGAEGAPIELRFELNQVALFTKAYVPDTPLHCLNATGDTTENWDVLNHAPPVCEREHYTLGSLFLQDRQGFRRASDGPFVCLADGINWNQWRWMAQNWQVAYDKLPTRVLGATIVWFDAALENEFGDYVTYRTMPRHRVCAELMKRGAPLLSILNVRDLDVATGPLFIPRPELLAADEWQRVLQYAGGPVMTLGREGADTLACRVYEQGQETRSLTTPLAAELPEEMPEPPNYLFWIYAQPVDEGFLRECAAWLIDLGGGPEIVNDVPEAMVLGYETEPGWVRLLIGNEAHHYVIPQIDLHREIAEVRIASHFPGKPIIPEGTTLMTRVPPRGMVVLDVAVGGAGY